MPSPAPGLDLFLFYDTFVLGVFFCEQADVFSEEVPKEPAFELASCSSAVLADFCGAVNKIPLPIRLSRLLLNDDTVRARRNRLLARANSPHALIVSGTSL
jgi:hypothetical protein